MKKIEALYSWLGWDALVIGKAGKHTGTWCHLGENIDMERHQLKYMLSAAVIMSGTSWSYAAPPEPTWEVVNPATTGIPGEDVRVMDFAPDGRMWVGARWPFWGDGGLGAYDFATQTWETHTNVQGSPTAGFPSAFPNDIEFGPDGSVWCATLHGLVHYTAGKWTLYNAATSPLPYSDVTAIDLDSQGNVWINVRRGASFSDAAIYKYDGESWTDMSIGAGTAWDGGLIIPNGITVDPSDHVWVGNQAQAGFAEFDGSAWAVHTPPNIFPPFPPLLDGVFADSHGSVWGRRINGGDSFFSFDGSEWQQFNSQNTPFIATSIADFSEDDAGVLYVGNWAGQVIRQIAPGSSVFELAATVNGAVFNVRPQSNGDIYLTTAGAVRHLRADAVQVRAFNTYNTGLPWYTIDDFHVDRDGNFWTASGESGLSRFDGERWRNWGEHNAGSEPYPWAGNEPMGGFMIDSQGRGWMGGNGIGQWDPNTGQFLGFWDGDNNPILGVTLITHFAEDVNGTIFAVTDTGFVVKFNGTEWVDASPPNGFVSFTYVGLYQSDNGLIYDARPVGINVWDGSSWSSVPGLDEAYLFSVGGLVAFATDPDGSLWVGVGDGLVHYENGNKTLFNPGNSPMPASTVHGIDVRDDGLVAAACADYQSAAPYPNGVCLIEGNPSNLANWNVSRYGTSNIPHYQLSRVKFDANGDLWVSAVSEGCAFAKIGGVQCLADVNGDGQVTPTDFTAWINAFNNNLPECDQNGDGSCTPTDFTAWIDNFNTGC